MESAKILVVDDDAELLELLRMELEASHYQVVLARDGLSALEQLASTRPDLMILDINLPLLDGLSVCRQVRTHNTLPILMLSSQRDELDKVIGLEVGADDYLGKPYHPRELIARIRALLRRSRPLSVPPADRLRADGLEIDLNSHQATEQNRPLMLTPIEFALLESLLRNFGNIVSRARLLENIWGADFEGSTRTVDTHMRNLRLKLSPHSPRLESVRGVGFRLVSRAAGD